MFFRAGLFHRVIAASGTALNGLMTQTAEQANKFSMNLAKIFAAAEDEIADPAKRVQFLRKADPGELSKRASEVVDIKKVRIFCSFLTIVFL